MLRPIKKLAGVAVGLVALGSGALLAANPAQAAPNWDLYNRGTSANVAVGDVLSGYGNLRFVSLINGAGVVIDCQVPSGSTLFSHTVTATDQRSVAPGGTLSIGLALDPVISTVAAGPKQGVCRDTTSATWATGVAIDVTTTGGVATLSMVAPNPGVSGIYAGTLNGSVALPAGVLSFWDPKIGCGGTGPNVPTTLTGSYNAAATSGVVTPTPNQAVTATPTAGCTMTGTRLATGALTLAPKLSLVY